jgi:hypothetical protein
MSKPRPGYVPSKPFAKGPDPRRNTRGRLKGSRDRTPRNVWDVLRNRGDRDPLDLLSEISNSQLVEMPLRIQAAGILASYKHGKRPCYRYIEDIVTGLSPPKTVEQATQYQAAIAVLVATGKLDVEGGLAVTAMLKDFVIAKTATDMEQRLLALEEQAARGIQGGGITVISAMPPMPGTEGLIMPNAGPPPIEQDPNPWAAPNVLDEVRSIPKRSGRPPKGFKYGPEIKPPDDPGVS